MNYRLELGHLISKNGGGTFKNLTDVLYYTRLFKYVHKKHFRMINNLFYKVTADWKLKELCDRGLLFSPQEDVYCATTKVDPILKEANQSDYIIDTLPDKPKGIGDINELNNTEVFIQLSKQENFFTLLYPSFGYIIPDALLVEKRDDKYRLTFIEVENPSHKESYVLNKEKNYIKLSKDIQVYKVWLGYCDQLGFKKPPLEEFKFNYRIIKTN